MNLHHRDLSAVCECLPVDVSSFDEAFGLRFHHAQLILRLLNNDAESKSASWKIRPWCESFLLWMFLQSESFVQERDVMFS